MAGAERGCRIALRKAVSSIKKRANNKIFRIRKDVLDMKKCGCIKNHTGVKKRLIFYEVLQEEIRAHILLLSFSLASFLQLNSFFSSIQET